MLKVGRRDLCFNSDLPKQTLNSLRQGTGLFLPARWQVQSSEARLQGLAFCLCYLVLEELCFNLSHLCTEEIL